MAEPMDGYCVDPATELQDAHDKIHEGEGVPDVTYHGDELMKPNTSGDPLTGE